MKVFYRILFSFIILLCVNDASAQLTSHALSNRRIGYANDASAVSWNPALLGMVQGTDLLFASMHDKQFNVMPQYAGFLKFGGLAGGIILPTDSVSLFQPGIPMTLHAGYGFPLISDYVWIGGAGKYSDDGTVNVRYAASLMLSLHSSFYLSGGIDNLYTRNENHRVMSFMGAYSPLDWFTIHARVLYSQDSVLFAGKEISPELGVSAGVLSNFLVASASYNPTYNQMRLGLEMNLGPISVGTLNNFNTASGNADSYGYGVALARLNFSGHKAIAPARKGLPSFICHPEELRWQPNFPNGKKELFGIMKEHGGEHEDIADDLESDLKNADHVNDTIHARHYARFETKATTGGIPQRLLGHKNPDYAVIGLANDTTKDMMSMKVRVQDKTGRMIANVSDSAFTVSDTTMRIVSVKQAVADNPVPVDFVILMDCSGSMGDEIDEVRANVSSFVQKLKGGGIDYNLGCILYGESIFGILEPTPDLNQFTTFFQQAGAIGMDEITSTAIERATQMNLRPTAQRIFILITDECAIQKNGSNTEISLLKKLWDKGIKLYSVVNTAENNGAVMTRLSLGKEFSIRQPFTSILNEIAKDVSTTYDVRLQPKEKPLPPKVTVLKGLIRGDDGEIIKGSLSLSMLTPTPMIDSINARSHGYSFVIPNHAPSELSVKADGYRPYSEIVDFTYVMKGDTLIKDIILKKRIRTIVANMVDTLGNTLIGEMKLSDNVTMQTTPMIPASTSGYHGVMIPPGKAYTMKGNVSNYSCEELQINEDVFKQSDTVVLTMRCREQDVFVSGYVVDENGMFTKSTLIIEDVLTGMKVSTIETDASGYYSILLRPGRDYRFTPMKKDFIPESKEFIASQLKPGMQLSHNPQLTSIKQAISKGMTFSLKNIFFDSNKSDIKPESEAELQKLLKFMNDNPSVCLEISAHTDDVGSVNDNESLSQRRAESVVKYLNSNGIEPRRLTAKGYGELKPIADNKEEAGRLQNRRVEFALINCK